MALVLTPHLVPRSPIVGRLQADRVEVRHRFKCEPGECDALGDVSGDYQICLTVGDSNNCDASQDCIFLTVKPQVALHIELTWDTGSSDIDLHYRAPFGNWFTSGDDVYYLSMTPDWGGNNRGQPDNNSANDPRLDVDNIVGFGPENINQDLLFDNPAATSIRTITFQ